MTVVWKQAAHHQVSTFSLEWPFVEEDEMGHGRPSSLPSDVPVDSSDGGPLSLLSSLQSSLALQSDALLAGKVSPSLCCEQTQSDHCHNILLEWYGFKPPSIILLLLKILNTWQLWPNSMQSPKSHPKSHPQIPSPNSTPNPISKSHPRILPLNPTPKRLWVK